MGIYSKNLVLQNRIKQNRIKQKNKTEPDKTNLIKMILKYQKLLYKPIIKRKKFTIKVYKNIKRFAPDYEHIIYDDEECEEF